MPYMLLQAAGMVPDECSLSGLCAAFRPEPLVPPGVMYTAVALILVGAYGYQRQRDRRSETGDQGSAPPNNS